jgi:hypothetical protein
MAANILGQARIRAAAENFKLVVGQVSSFARREQAPLLH